MKEIPLLHKCLVIENKLISKDIFKLKFKSPDIALHSYPGQFIQIKVTENFDPFLRRPFSISRVDKKYGIVDILYKKIGRGTDLMTRFKKNELVDVVGPLGNSFSLNGDFTDAIIIAGGIGFAPVFFLIDELLQKDKSIKLIYGTKTSDQLFNLDEYKNLIDILICTEDGSCGKKGLVTDLLLNELGEYSELFYGFACGPNAMYKSLRNLILDKISIQWQVSLESNMACGTGVCQGCAVKTKKNNFSLICSQGPVFDLRDVHFND